MPSIVVLFALVCSLTLNLLTTYAQIVIRGNVVDSTNSPIPATLYVARAIEAGYFHPEGGTVDSTKTRNGSFNYTIRRKGAYYLCFRLLKAESKVATNDGAPKDNSQKKLSAIDIPLIIESLQSDTIDLTVTAGAASVRVLAKEPHGYIADMYAVHQSFAEQYALARAVSDKAYEQHLKPAPFNDSALRSSLCVVMRSNDKHIAVRRLAAYYLSNRLPAGMYDWKALSQFNDEVLSLLPYTSYQWSWGGRNPVSVSLMSDTVRRYAMMQGLRRNNPEIRTRFYILMNLMSLAQYYHQDSTLLDVCAEFEKDYLRHLYFKDDQELMQDMFKRYCGKNHRIVPDKQMPEFSLKLMNDRRILTNAAMKGKTYLIDFWGTWCSGCVHEIAGLEALYAQYRKQGFTIISIANESKAKLALFRKNRHPMPWFHASVTPKQWAQLNKTFETYSMLPNPILVGADGSILATRNEAMGQRLRDKLASVFDGK
jgi:thiol-disulfide isomerase/thioredoxin